MDGWVDRSGEEGKLEYFGNTQRKRGGKWVVFERESRAMKRGSEAKDALNRRAEEGETAEGLAMRTVLQ